MKFTTLAIALFTTFTIGTARAQEMPEMPKPTKDHELLKQFAGEWDVEGTMHIPGQDPVQTSGTESARMVGDFWVMGEHKGSFMGMPFTGIMTLGYSPEKKKYVGTWFDSGNSYMWTYEGSFDDAGKVLTLDTEGPCPMKGGQIVKMQETVEMRDPKTKVITSKVMDNGQWVKGMEMVGKKKN